MRLPAFWGRGIKVGVDTEFSGKRLFPFGKIKPISKGMNYMRAACRFLGQDRISKNPFHRRNSGNPLFFGAIPGLGEESLKAMRILKQQPCCQFSSVLPCTPPPSGRPLLPRSISIPSHSTCRGVADSLLGLSTNATMDRAIEIKAKL
jgi:hypothetical protein